MPSRKWSEEKQRLRSKENRKSESRQRKAAKDKHGRQDESSQKELRKVEEERNVVIEKYAAFNENEFMKLGPTRLVECFKLLITSHRLREPDFEHGRLRDAYNEALGQLMQTDQSKIAERNSQQRRRSRSHRRS